METRFKDALLGAARNALQAHLGIAALAAGPLEADPSLRLSRGVFVSLHRGDELRGCIGTLEASRPLAETIRLMAVSAASRDPRFPPVARAELADLTIEISVLGLPRLAAATEVEVGRHGLCIGRDGCRGVLLPQVAKEHGWTAREFLDQTCHKAGLPEGAWADPRTKIEIFEADVFSEA